MTTTNEWSKLPRIEGEEALDDGISCCTAHDRTLHCDVDLLSRPILVGYAFGPKKMSTMGVVMAEASKTSLSSVSTTVLVEEAEDDLPCDDEVVYNEHKRSSSKDCIQQPPSTPPGSSPCQEKYVDKNNEQKNGNIMLSLGSYNGGLNNIVRYLHSSCSSVDTNSTSTTLLTTGTTVADGVTPSSASTSKFGASISERSSCGGESSQRHHQRLRVSFVPLDPDLPLEGQHGAKMDIVLHKLTEDILCLSRYAPLFNNLVPSLGERNGQLEQILKECQHSLPGDAQAAIMRVHRLMRYHKKYPSCWLADDPAKVLTLMSRSDIAIALAGCLVGVKSASGIPVASPRFFVWDQNQMERVKANPQTMAKSLQDARMTYPLIAKPLQAAGTKTSHYMTVLLHESSLAHVHDSPCLLQQYANHDAVLFKVYVLGNNVRVYQRPSLPNLPPLDFTDENLASNIPSYVDFDSQRPYPRLSAFGVKEDRDFARPYLSSITRCSSSSSPSLIVTAEEVQPIVDALKKAFGLELFGFDILITSTSEKEGRPEEDPYGAGERQMLVVDVNYFPSYKEVHNFPSLLAQYLTQRAIDSRRQQGPQSQTEER